MLSFILQEVKDPRYNAEKMNQKDAKNIFELTNKLETEYTHVISDVIQVLLLFFYPVYLDPVAWHVAHPLMVEKVIDYQRHNQRS